MERSQEQLTYAIRHARSSINRMIKSVDAPTPDYIDLGGTEQIINGQTVGCSRVVYEIKDGKGRLVRLYEQYGQVVDHRGIPTGNYTDQVVSTTRNYLPDSLLVDHEQAIKAKVEEWAQKGAEIRQQQEIMVFPTFVSTEEFTRLLR